MAPGRSDYTLGYKDESGGSRKGHHSNVCRRTDPRLNRSTPARVQVLPAVGAAALQRSSLQQENLELTIVPKISKFPGKLELLGQIGEQNLFFTFTF